jgi:hypothetical protein
MNAQAQQVIETAQIVIAGLRANGISEPATIYAFIGQISEAIGLDFDILSKAVEMLLNAGY